MSEWVSDRVPFECLQKPMAWLRHPWSKKLKEAWCHAILKYRHLFYRTFPHYPHLIHAQSLKLKLSSRSLLLQSQLSTNLKTIDIRAISEKRNKLRLAWFDMIIIEQCYLFRRGFTKEIAKIKLIQRDLKQADVISFRMEGRTQKQR